MDDHFEYIRHATLMKMGLAKNLSHKLGYKSKYAHHSPEFRQTAKILNEALQECAIYYYEQGLEEKEKEIRPYIKQLEDELRSLRYTVSKNKQGLKTKTR